MQQKGSFFEHEIGLASQNSLTKNIETELQTNKTSSLADIAAQKHMHKYHQDKVYRIELL